MLFNVQVLRAIAALMVVHGHAGAGGLGLRIHLGGLNGVDLFFVISGFIIAYVADVEPHQFMMRRLIRIVPIYWASTLVIYVLVIVWPSVFKTATSDLELLVRSLLFVPDPRAVHTQDGLPHPTLAGGWTLNFEMYFYVTFGLALAVSRRWATLIAATALGSIIAIVNLTTLDTSPVAHFYGYPIVLEFMFGMLAFHLVRAFEKSAWRERAPAVQRAVLVTIVAVTLALLLSRVASSTAPRWFSNGIPAFFLVVAAILLERVHDMKITNRWAVLIGDASYVLYLSHAYVVFGVIRVVLRHRTFSEVPGQLIVFGLMVLSSIVAILIHRFVEKPMLHFLKKRLIHVGTKRRPA
jgi:exopolysaccharide production protein ExoZ